LAHRLARSAYPAAAAVRKQRACMATPVTVDRSLNRGGRGALTVPIPEQSASQGVAQLLPIGTRHAKPQVMVVECRIENCGKTARAKGLCSAHYARLYRGGDPSVKRQGGPQRDAARAAAVALFPDWSLRTQARYWKAMRQLQRVDSLRGTNHFETALKASTRPNGSINVSKLERRAESLAALFVTGLGEPTKRWRG
jgi:hypothetical protein